MTVNDFVISLWCLFFLFSVENLWKTTQASVRDNPKRQRHDMNNFAFIRVKFET